MAHPSSPNETDNAVQHLQNRSFDTLLGVNMVEMVAYDPVAATLRRVIVDGQGGLTTGGGANTIKMDLNANGDPVYLGKAAPGSATSAAVWQLQKLTYNGSNKLTDVQWADGNTNFDNVYDDRAAASYS